ncbi:MAG: 50S ribosomal protein L20, partial [Anaerococcus sp.]|nr:50S ribosomal protein L20 [Anaerococcus sp.]
LKKANIDINRKMLAEIAVENPAEFTKIVELANQNA